MKSLLKFCLFIFLATCIPLNMVGYAQGITRALRAAQIGGALISATITSASVGLTYLLCKNNAKNSAALSPEQLRKQQLDAQTEVQTASNRPHYWQWHK